MKKAEVTLKIKEILLEVLQDESLTIDMISDTMPFFGTESEVGLIEDSLLILEIVSILADEFDIDPSEFDEDIFINVEKVSNMVVEQLELATV